MSGEGSAVVILFLQAFALMLAYYLVRPVREALILTQGGAEFRSYAVAVQALLLVLIIPAYSAWVRRIEARRIYLLVNAFFASHLLLFCLASLAGWRIGFAFFVWCSLFSVMAVTQFWAFATDLFSVHSGERLFGLIAVGVSAGAVAGAQLSAALFDAIGPHGLMLASAAALSLATALAARARTAIPDAARSRRSRRARRRPLARRIRGDRKEPLPGRDCRARRPAQLDHLGRRLRAHELAGRHRGP